MSPAKPRKAATLGRPRSEIVTAVAVGAGIVAATLLLIWALRPGEPGVDGTGGILSRQPRVSLLVVLAGLALLWALWWVRNGRRRPRRLSGRLAIVVAVAVPVAGAIVAGIFWPGGLVRHWEAPPDFSDFTVPTTPEITAAPTETTAPSPDGSTAPDSSASTAPGTTAG